MSVYKTIIRALSSGAKNKAIARSLNESGICFIVKGRDTIENGRYLFWSDKDKTHKLHILRPFLYSVECLNNLVFHSAVDVKPSDVPALKLTYYNDILEDCDKDCNE